MEQSPKNSTVRLLHDAFELAVDAAAKEEVEAALGREGGTSVDEVNEAHTFLALSVAVIIRQLCGAGNGEAEAIITLDRLHKAWYLWGDEPCTLLST